MSNSRKFTTNFNAVNDRLRTFLKTKGCTTRAKRERAKERAVSLPNRLDLLPNAARRQNAIDSEGRAS